MEWHWSSSNIVSAFPHQQAQVSLEFLGRFQAAVISKLLK
jgi:hypothetical protein